MRLLCALIMIASVSAHADLSNTELERRIDILSEEITSLKAYQMNISKNDQAYGLSPSASKVYFIPQGLSIGGYGEIVYNHKAKEEQDGDEFSEDPTAEALRYVIYLGYKFNEKWVLNTEIEIEHVSEVFNEFMYLDYLHDTTLNFRAGLMLMPMGFLNQLHEPVLFPSVNRPDVESKIIPTTWREIGVGTFGTIGKIDYNFYIVNGGNADDIKPANFRGARKKGGAGDASDNQNASTGAAVVRADYNFDTQSSIGASIYKGQASSENTENLETSLYEVHGQYQNKGLRVRALYAQLNYDNVDKWNDVNTAIIGGNAQSNLQSMLQGGYVEALYNVWQGQGASSLEPFFRYERLNLNADYNKADYTYDGALDYHTYRVGLAYKPTVRIVFKADYGVVENKDDSGVNEFNLGMGFNF